MTNQNAPAGSPGGAPPTSPPPWYWTARGMAKFKTKAMPKIVHGVDRQADAFLERLDGYADALGLTRQHDPQKRLLAYYNKPYKYDDAIMMVEQGLLKVPY